MATEPRTSHAEPAAAQERDKQAASAQSAQSAQQQQQDQKSRLEADKKRLGEEREHRAKAQEEREKKKGTPTPTQEECDMLKLGHPVELANDGSGPDPNMPQQKQMTADENQKAGYSHRSMGAAR